MDESFIDNDEMDMSDDDSYKLTDTGKRAKITKPKKKVCKNFKN